MTIKDMHYDFKRKLNKVDSQQNKNLVIPEIDLALNEAQEIFVKSIAFPRLTYNKIRTKYNYGFETSQRTIDDIRTLVIDDSKINVSENNICELPKDYWHFIKGYVNISKGNCRNVKARLHIRQHDDEFEESPFDKSSFEWRTVNGVFVNKGIKLYTEDFKADVLSLSYVKSPKFIHNAEDFRDGKYRLLSGEVLSGHVDCELPEHTHREIVDIAVLIVSGEMQLPDYQLKAAKLSFNNIIN